jgi:hypothetical protein
MSPRAVRGWAVAAVLLVALVAAVISYAHQRDLAQEHGEAWRAYLLPLSVDGMLLASTLAIVDRRRRREPAGWVPWLGLALGILASLAANVAAARPDPVSQAIAAWPPAALAIAIETLVVVLRRPKTTEPPTEPAVSLGVDPEPPTQVAAPALPAEVYQQVTIPDTDLDHAEPDLLARLLAQGASRRQLAAELGVSEYRAKQLLAASRNGNGAHP